MATWWYFYLMTRYSNNLKWEVLKRQEEIERCIYWQGFVHRRHLIDAFGISPQQASTDLSFYQKQTPENLVFNNSLKRYEPSESFEPKYIRTHIGDYLSWGNSSQDSVYTTIPSPYRAVEPLILRRIINAIHLGKAVSIIYQSMSSEDPTRRIVDPHSIVFDGFRHHVRAYCHLRNEYRDFVLGRIIEAGDFSKTDKPKELDEKWNTLVALQIAPHPRLSDKQKEIIEHDFNMTNGVVVLRVREAMLFYTLTQLHLDKFTNKRTPAEQQIVLLNPNISGLL